MSHTSGFGVARAENGSSREAPKRKDGLQPVSTKDI